MLKIKELRLAKSLSQEELAKKLGVTTATIGMIETDKRKPSISLLEKMSQLFEVSTDYIIDNKEQQKDNKVISALLSAGIDAEKMNKDEIDKMIDYAKFILQNKK
jgi:transcriptional regulator with XRE-family HTH domain